MVGADAFDVEVVYALPGRQCVIKLRVDAGTTAGQAVRQSGLLSEFPEIDPAEAKLGAFGRDHLSSRLGRRPIQAAVRL